MANDLQYYAYTLNKAFIEINKPPDFARLHAAHHAAYKDGIKNHRSLFHDPLQEALAFINELPGFAGFITNRPAGRRMYYTEAKAQKRTRSERR